MSKIKNKEAWCRRLMEDVRQVTKKLSTHSWMLELDEQTKLLTILNELDNAAMDLCVAVQSS